MKPTMAPYEREPLEWTVHVPNQLKNSTIHTSQIDPALRDVKFCIAEIVVGMGRKVILDIFFESGEWRSFPFDNVWEAKEYAEIMAAFYKPEARAVR